MRSHPLLCAAWGEDFKFLPAKPGSKPSQQVVLLCVPTTFHLHHHPSTAGVHFEVQANWVSLPCLTNWVSLPFLPTCAFQSLHLVTQLLPDSRAWTPRWGHCHPLRALCSPWCCSTALPWHCRSQLCPRGGYFSLAPLAWWNPPGSGFSSAQQKQRHQQKQSRAFFIPMQLLDGVT